MSYLEQKEPPKREDRLKACIAYSGTICGLANRPKACCMDDGNGGSPRVPFACCCPVWQC